MSRGWAAIMLASLLASPVPAQAHKMKLFAAAEGAEISGYAYFSSGGRAVDSALTVTAPDGSVLFTGVTDGEGTFRFTASRRIDHALVVDGGDGHMARFTVTAGELPESLPGTPLPGGEGAVPLAAAPSVPASLPDNSLPGASSAPALQAMIEQSVARQIRPLREQLDAYQEQVRWHDVAGGIGTIIGLAGLAFGLTRRKGRSS